MLKSIKNALFCVFQGLFNHVFYIYANSPRWSGSLPDTEQIIQYQSPNFPATKDRYLYLPRDFSFSGFRENRISLESKSRTLT